MNLLLLLFLIYHFHFQTPWRTLQQDSAHCRMPGRRTHYFHLFTFIFSLLLFIYWNIIIFFQFDINRWRFYIEAYLHIFIYYLAGDMNSLLLLLSIYYFHFQALNIELCVDTPPTDGNMDLLALVLSLFLKFEFPLKLSRLKELL